MSKEDMKEQKLNGEKQDELFSNQDQSDDLSEYEFFLPEIDSLDRHPLSPISSGEKKKDDDQNNNQKNEFFDFFLP